jgi:hypothetical protein
MIEATDYNAATAYNEARKILQERFGHTAFLETDFENLQVQAYQLAKNWQQ